MHSKNGRLILLPNLLSHEASFKDAFVEMLRPTIKQLDGLYIESQKGGRSFMSLFKETSLNQATLSYVNEHTKKDELNFLLEPIEEGQVWGLVSDGGLPACADPGSNLVLRARQKGLQVETVGAICSMTAALILSGLPGQNFTFHGYLPRDEKDRKKKLEELEAISKSTGYTQLFIEAPYRNVSMVQSMSQVLHNQTYVSIAIDISTPREEVVTCRVVELKKREVNCEKRPAVYCLNSSL